MFDGKYVKLVADTILNDAVILATIIRCPVDELKDGIPIINLKCIYTDRASAKFIYNDDKLPFQWWWNSDMPPFASFHLEGFKDFYGFSLMMTSIDDSSGVSVSFNVGKTFHPTGRLAWKLYRALLRQSGKNQYPFSKS